MGGSPGDVSEVPMTQALPHSLTLLQLHLRSSSFSNPFVASSNPSFASPTSQLIFQPFRCFTYVTAHFPTLQSLRLPHSSFFNPSVDSPMSQALHLRHLASSPCYKGPFMPHFKFFFLCSAIVLCMMDAVLLRLSTGLG